MSLAGKDVDHHSLKERASHQRYHLNAYILKADFSQYLNRYVSQGKKSQEFLSLAQLSPLVLLLVHVRIVCEHHTKSVLSNPTEGEMDMKK